MELTDEELREIAAELDIPVQELQSDAVRDCAESVMRDNPDLSKSQAFAVCQDMENEGRLQDAVHVTLAELQEPGAIEREEEEDGKVRYGRVLLLAPGVWGDAGSGRHIHYSEEGIQASADRWEDNRVNLFHERENETTDIGEVDLDSIFIGEDDGGLYGDIVLHMENPASEFADEALQEALKTNGREGLQGPSVELRGEEYDTSQHPPELLQGTFNGVALVGLGVSPGPGSEDAAFAEQTRERAVALAGTDRDVDVLTLQNNVTMDQDHILEQLDERGISVGDDPDEETLQTLAAAFDIELQEEEEEPEEEEEEEESEGEGEEPEEEEEDDVDINLEDVASQVNEIGERVSENTERIEAMAERFEDLDEGASLSDLFETVSNVSETLETLADAEDVEELEQRLQELEDEPEESRSLADIDGAEPTEGDDEKVLVELGTNSPEKPSYGV